MLIKGNNKRRIIKRWRRESKRERPHCGEVATGQDVILQVTVEAGWKAPLLPK